MGKFSLNINVNRKILNIKVNRKILRIMAGILLTPIILFILLVGLLYVPPIQNYVVDKVAEAMSDSTGLSFRIDEVRLSFPLDLKVNGVKADLRGDSVLNIREMKLDLEFFPLFKGQANVNGFELNGAGVNTRDLVSNTQIIGVVGKMTADLHGVNWKDNLVHIDGASLVDADLTVLLCDTAAEDTTASQPWLVELEKASLNNVKAFVSMPGDSMRITAHVGEGLLEKGHFDTGKPLYTLAKAEIKNSLIHYDSGTAQSNAMVGNRNPNDLLAQIQAVQTLDPNHLHFSQVGAGIKNLSYNAKGELDVEVDHFTFREDRTGFAVNNVSGNIHYDSDKLQIPALAFSTPYSKINGGVTLPFGALTGENAGMKISLDGAIGWQDVEILAKGYVPDDVLRVLPRRDLTMKGIVSGNLNHLSLTDLNVGMNDVFSLSGDAFLRDVAEDWRSGKANFSFKGYDLTFINKLLPKDLQQTVRVPRMLLAAAGNVSFNADNYATDMRLSAGGGSAHVKGSVRLGSENYQADIVTQNLPLKPFLPAMPLSPLTASVKANGHGFDVLSEKSNLQADVNLKRFAYDTYNLSGITARAKSQRGVLSADFKADNNLLQGDGTITAQLGKEITGTLQTNIPFLNLTALAAMSDTLQMGISGDVKFAVSRDLSSISTTGYLSNIYFNSPTLGITTEDIDFDFFSMKDSTAGSVGSGDMSLSFESQGEIADALSKLASLASVLQEQISSGNIDESAWREQFPTLALQFSAGKRNPLSRLLANYDIAWQSCRMNLNCSAQTGINGQVSIGSMNKGALMLDTIYARIYNDTLGTQLSAYIQNYKRKNPNKFTASLKSYLHEHGAGIETQFKDQEGRVGLDLGMRASLLNDGIEVQLYPEKPTIAYRKFIVNKDNYLFFSPKGQIGANIDLLADDGTGLSLYGTPTDSLNDLTLSLSHLNLAELSRTVPYIPQLGGFLSGDIHLNDDHKVITALGTFDVNNFSYEGIEMGNMGLEGFYLPKSNGEQYASAFISSNGKEVMELNGTYFANETFTGKGNLIDFPLNFLNGFLNGTDVMLSGIALGEFEVEGTIDNPVVNGKASVSDGHILSSVYGFDFKMDEKPIIIDKSTLTFDDYALYSSGRNPLVIKGDIDFRNLNKIGLDFAINANNFELINAKRRRESMVYGKVYTDFNGTMRGNTQNGISLRGNMSILPATNATYILKDSPLTVDNQLESLVQFVSFEDSVEIEEKPAEFGNFDLTLGISISDAARFNCMLSEDGESYVNLQGGGNLTFRRTRQGDMRLTGRLTVEEGAMKYALPVIPLKTFTLKNGSYIEFNGNVMNPTLNLTATERVKSTVTEGEQSRSVTFDVGIAITKTLENMGLEFTLDAPEDLMMQNTLASMTAAQRGKSAVTMLATGMFLTDDATNNGTGLKASNALNAFLQSEIQNIAGSALKTIDLSLGVESGTSEKGTSTTDYSFRFAKRFWGDRISVIIGGKVSTGADATNSAESFIDNISVEYRLDKESSRQLKLFYDRDTQDPLEGQISKAGAGIVLRKKSNRLGDLFIFGRKKEN